MPCHCFQRSFQSLLYVFLPTPPTRVQKTAMKIHRSTSLLFHKLLKPHILRKPSSTVELLLPWNCCWQRQPLVFYCFLETGTACPEPAAAAEIVVPARQDTDAQSAAQCTPKCNNSLLFSTLPCWDSTLNSEKLAHPKIQKGSWFVWVNMEHRCRNQRCYHSDTRPWRFPISQPLLDYHLQNLNTIHYYCSTYCTGQSEQNPNTSLVSLPSQWKKDPPGWPQHQSHSGTLWRTQRAINMLVLVNFSFNILLFNYPHIPKKNFLITWNISTDCIAKHRNCCCLRW